MAARRDAACAGPFRWRIPEGFNIGVACSDEQVADDPAVIEYGVGGAHRVRTFAELAKASNRLANALVGIGSLAASASGCSCRRASPRRPSRSRSPRPAPSRCL